MTGWDVQKSLAAIIELLLSRHPRGLRVLLGECPTPNAEEVRLLFAEGRDDLGVRVEGGASVPLAEQMVMNVERFNEVIGAAGGWKHVNAMVKEWAAIFPSSWRIVVDCVRCVRRGTPKIDGGQVGRIAERFGVDTETVRLRRKAFPEQIADYILQSPVSE